MADTTADLLLDELVPWGVRRIYGLPGDGCNGLMEALRIRRDRIEFVLVRHEEAAAFAASAHAKLTGRLGVCLATSGPGAIHLLNGLYDAKLDGAPVLALTGHTYSDLLGARYQQEIDVHALYADVAAYNVQVTSPAHAQLAVDMACRTAIGRRTVAHLNIPIDVQVATRSKPSPMAAKGATAPGVVEWRFRPSDADLTKAADLVAQGRRILVVAGRGCHGAASELDDLVRRLQAPVCKPLLGKDVLPDAHPHSLGGMGLLGTAPTMRAVKECDTLLMLGSNFPYLRYLPQKARVLQVDTKAERIGSRVQVDIGLVGDVGETLRALLPRLPQRRDARWLKALQGEVARWNEALEARASSTDLPLRPQAVARAVAKAMRPDAVIACDVGCVTVWAARHIPMGDRNRFLVSGTLASMGCGLPYAVAAQKEYPERQVIAFVGDGGLMMLPGELATAAQQKLPIKVVVLNNGSLGMIRWEQLVFLGNPSYGTDLPGIGFARLAEAMGLAAWRADTQDSLATGIQALLTAPGPALLECIVDPNEPPWPPTMELNSALKLGKALARGEPNRTQLALTLFRDQIEDHTPLWPRRHRPRRKRTEKATP